MVTSHSGQDDKNTSEPHNTHNNSHQASGNPPPVQKSSGMGFALTALMLSLIALGGSGYLFFQGKNTLDALRAQTDEKVSHAVEKRDENTFLLQQSVNDQKSLQQEVKNIQAALEESKIAYKNLERSYRELTSGRTQWLVDESESTLNITAQQLIFTGNTQIVQTTLENLEKRLNRFDRPELLSIKKGISDDLANLRQQPYVDIVSASLRLDRLRSDTDNLPLRSDSVLEESLSGPVSLSDKQGKWYQNLWKDLKTTAKDLVQIRKINSTDAMLLSPEQAYFIRQNIKMNLMDARLALLQHQADIYRKDLDIIINEVQHYFDTQSPAVTAWVEEVTQLKELNIQSPSTDLLKNSISAVRAYQNAYAVKEENRDDETITPLQQEESIASTEIKNSGESSSEEAVSEKTQQPSSEETQQPSVSPEPQEQHTGEPA